MSIYNAIVYEAEAVVENEIIDSGDLQVVLDSGTFTDSNGTQIFTTSSIDPGNSGIVHMTISNISSNTITDLEVLTIYNSDDQDTIRTEDYILYSTGVSGPWSNSGVNYLEISSSLAVGNSVDLYIAICPPATVTNGVKPLYFDLRYKTPLT